MPTAPTKSRRIELFSCSELGLHGLCVLRDRDAAQVPIFASSPARTQNTATTTLTFSSRLVMLLGCANELSNGWLDYRQWTRWWSNSTACIPLWRQRKSSRRCASALLPRGISMEEKSWRELDSWPSSPAQGELARAAEIRICFWIENMFKHWKYNKWQQTEAAQTQSLILQIFLAYESAFSIFKGALDAWHYIALWVFLEALLSENLFCGSADVFADGSSVQSPRWVFIFPFLSFHFFCWLCVRLTS
jgi:hypothetical protein